MAWHDRSNAIYLGTDSRPFSHSSPNKFSKAHFLSIKYTSTASFTTLARQASIFYRIYFPSEKD